MKKFKFTLKTGRFGNNFCVDKFVFPTSNGVIAQSGDKKVISLINCDGKKILKSEKTQNKVVFWHFPFFRGVQYFFCGIFAFLSALSSSTTICQPTIVKEKDLQDFYKKKLLKIVFLIIFSIAFSAVVFGFVPAKIGMAIVGLSTNTLLRNFVILCFKILLFFILLFVLRFFPSVNELLRFNRATDLVVSQNFRKKQQKNEKISINCTNFLNFLIFVFFFHFVVITLLGASFGFWFNLILHASILFCCAGVGYEILHILDNLGPLKFLGFLTAFLVFEKPSKTHIETVNVALTELAFLSSQKDREFMKENDKHAFTLVYNEVKNKLAGAGTNDKSEVDWLIATVLGKNRAEVKLVPTITDKQYQDIMRATERRAKGESLDNIFGWTMFYGLRIEVNKKVLTPRMETELLVEQVLKAQKNFKEPKILDLGTGSGAIAIAVKKNCDATVTAVDISKVALTVAQANAQKNDANIEFLHSNLFENLKRKRKFDIIVSNPPYIPTDEIEKLDKNVKDCDPHLALDGGTDGLDFYREIIPKATKRLTDGGILLVEIGKGQAAAVRKLFRENGYEEIKTIKDYNKIERIVCGKFR